MHDPLRHIKTHLALSSVSDEDQYDFLRAVRALADEQMIELASYFREFPGAVPAIVRFYQIKQLAHTRHDPELWRQILKEEAAFLDSLSGSSRHTVLV